VTAHEQRSRGAEEQTIFIQVKATLRKRWLKNAAVVSLAMALVAGGAVAANAVDSNQGPGVVDLCLV
jgi:hypothetical protein